MLGRPLSCPDRRAAADQRVRCCGGSSEIVLAEATVVVMIDDVDRQLIHALVREGRLTNRALAKAVGINEVTVASRVRQLLENRVISIGPQFDWKAAGYGRHAFAFVSTHGRSPIEVGQELKTWDGVHTVSATFGDAQLVLDLLAVDDRDLHALITKIAASRGVASVHIEQTVDFVKYPNGWAPKPFDCVEPECLPNPIVPFDAVDQQIVRCLQANGRASSVEIGREIGVSDPTVRARLKKMSDAGLLRVGARLDPLVTQDIRSVVFVGITAEGDAKKMGKLLRRFWEYPQVLTCSTSIGPCTIVLAVTGPSEQDTAQFINTTVWSLPGIRSVRSWPVVEVLMYRSDLVRLL